jgi:hypothetical protein
MRLVFAAAALAALCGYAGAATDPITDSDLVARASAVMGVKQAPVDRMLGVHKGVPVIVDIRCSDACPQHTVRIIHYTVDVGPVCTKLGGDTAAISASFSMTAIKQSFCIPHVLHQKKLYTDRLYQN